MRICTNTYILIATVVLDGKNWQEIIEYDIHPNKKIEEILKVDMFQLLLTIILKRKSLKMYHLDVIRHWVKWRNRIFFNKFTVLMSFSMFL